MYYVYILKTIDNRYYVGSTNNVHARLKRHRKGECRFTKSRLPVKLVFSEKHLSRSEAMLRERQIKAWKNKDVVEALLKSAGDGPIV